MSEIPDSDKSPFFDGNHLTSSTTAADLLFDIGEENNLIGDQEHRQRSLAYLAEDLLNEVGKVADDDEYLSEGDDEDEEESENETPDDGKLVETESINDRESHIRPSETSSSKNNKTSETRKRKNKTDGGPPKKAKKKSNKTQFQRKNIKKIIGEEKLNDSTLRALKEEQDRQLRLLQDIQFDSSVFKEEKKDLVIKSSFNQQSAQVKLEPSAGDTSLNKSSDQSVCIIEESSTFNQTRTAIPVTDLTQDDEDTSLRLTRCMSSKFGDDDDDDDDCRIISESERLKEDQILLGKKLKNVHMNDSFNVPDENGMVLINVNHPREDPDLYLIPFLARHVKPHQIGAVRFMYDNIVESMERVKDKSVGFGCILAHAMGLGKTLISISFIETFLRCSSTNRCVLCIVPINTIQNWVNEFNYWLPEDGQQKLDNDTIINYKRPFKLYLINDFSKTAKSRADIIINWKRTGGVLLIGYEMFRTLLTFKPTNPKPTKKSSKKEDNVIDLEEEDRLVLKQSEVEEALLTPCLVVCDEGHRIKNSSANIAKTLQQIRTKRRIVLTGYPLQNNLIEYWCMVNFVRPSYLGTKSEFCNMFERPIMNGQCNDSTQEDVRLMRMRSHVLHSLLEGFVQRRGHDVFLNSLPRKQEYVILLMLSDVQKALYLAFMEAIGATNPGEKINPLRTFAMCCKIWNHPDVLYRYNQNKDADLDLDIPELSQQQQTNGVQAKSKGRGTAAKASNNLPQYVPTNSSYLMLEDSGFNPFGGAPAADMRSSNRDVPDPAWADRILEKYQPDILSNGAKLMMAFSLIEESIKAGDKILLFSQSLLSLNLIEEMLQKCNVPNTSRRWAKNVNYFRLDGSTSGIERERLIKDFNKPNNDLWLFLLSTRAGCLGINLIGANRVIVLDASWNPCHDAQAVCRVFRYGQTKNCYIYRLIADHTMEKKIYDRQINKQSVSDRVIDEIQSENHFTRTQVEKLIHYVKEQAQPADLSDMPSKYDDSVLVTACHRHQNLITREPFTHESLLIDKKEYQLSEREKQQAFREYQNDKKYFPYRPNAYNLYYQRFPSNPAQLLQNQMNYSSSIHQLQQQTSGGLSMSHSSPNLTRPTHPILPRPSDQYQQVDNYSSSYFRSSQTQASSSYASYDGSLSSSSPSPMQFTTSSSTISDMNSTPYLSSQLSTTSSNQFTSNNVDSYNQTTQNVMNNSNPAATGGPMHNLKDVKIHSFIANSQIVVPTSEPGAAATQPIVIQPGDKVYILKTPKGVYLRTPDKKYIALRNKSLEDSFMPTTSSPPTPQPYASTSFNNGGGACTSASLADNSNYNPQAEISSNQFITQMTPTSSTADTFQPILLNNINESVANGQNNVSSYSNYLSNPFFVSNNVYDPAANNNGQNL